MVRYYSFDANELIMRCHDRRVREAGFPVHYFPICAIRQEVVMSQKIRAYNWVVDIGYHELPDEIPTQTEI